jgi:cell fate (sporulation/competence/biofilm development) regulator YmcA (YheA/YmcA/DUF963 family)
MSDFEQQLQSLKKELFDMPLVNDFFRLRDAILADEALMTLEHGFQHHQKLMAKCINDDEKYRFHKTEYEKQKEAFDTHPLVINYLTVKAELEALLLQMKSILE